MLKANWIVPSYLSKKVCPLFRKDFTVSKRVKSAFLHITARGVYEARLNSRRVGDFVMAPGWTSYHNRIQVQTYDVTELLGEDNVLILELAEGWFWRLKNKKPKAIIAELHIVYADGSEEYIGTDESWIVAKSNLRFCHLYNGIKYNAALAPVFKYRAKIAKDNSQALLVSQQGETVKEQERLKVKDVFVTPKGETVLDFGQNMTGYLEFTVDAKAGDKASFSFAEILDKDGNFYNENYRKAKAIYEYICKDGVQTYKPNLTFYGFRYVRVDSYPTEIRPENFTAIVVHSDMKRTGYIESSDAMLNQLFSNIIWGQKGNFLDIPTDCPQRDERLGWTGDAQVFARTASTTYRTDKFFKKWLHDLACDQRENGAITDVCPDLLRWESHGSSAWADAIVVVTYWVYRTYGDTQVIKDQFDAMKKWILFMEANRSRKSLERCLLNGSFRVIGLRRNKFGIKF